MRFSPSLAEQASFDVMGLEERFHFAVARIVESEEVWSLGGGDGWLIHGEEDNQAITIWPYQQMARECAEGVYENSMPISVSLEQFLYGLLKQCQSNNIMVEVNPAAGETGYLMSADQLYEVLESMVESGSYYLEG